MNGWGSACLEASRTATAVAHYHPGWERKDLLDMSMNTKRFLYSRPDAMRSLRRPAGAMDGDNGGLRTESRPLSGE